MSTQSQIPKDAELVQLPPPSAVVTRHISSSYAKHWVKSVKFWYFFWENLVKLKKPLTNGSKTVPELWLATPSLPRLPLSGHLGHWLSWKYQGCNFSHWCLFLHVKKLFFLKKSIFSPLRNVSLLFHPLLHTQRQVQNVQLQRDWKRISRLEDSLCAFF